MRRLSRLLLTTLLVISPKIAEAQFPFFSAQAPWKYAFENRTSSDSEGNIKNISVAKLSFRKVPIFLSAAYTHNNHFEDNSGFGVGLKKDFKNSFFLLPVLEGSLNNNKFSGARILTTTKLGRCHLDFHPFFDTHAEYKCSDINFGIKVKGVYIGASSVINSQISGPFFKDSYVRAVRNNRGTFADIGYNPRDKKVRVSFQKSFW